MKYRLKLVRGKYYNHIELQRRIGLFYKKCPYILLRYENKGIHANNVFTLSTILEADLDNLILFVREVNRNNCPYKHKGYYIHPVMVLNNNESYSGTEWHYSEYDNGDFNYVGNKLFSGKDVKSLKSCLYNINIKHLLKSRPKRIIYYK